MPQTQRRHSGGSTDSCPAVRGYRFGDLSLAMRRGRTSPQCSPRGRRRARNAQPAARPSARRVVCAAIGIGSHGVNTTRRTRAPNAGPEPVRPAPYRHLRGCQPVRELPPSAASTTVFARWPPTVSSSSRRENQIARTSSMRYTSATPRRRSPCGGVRVDARPRRSSHLTLSLVGS